MKGNSKIKYGRELILLLVAAAALIAAVVIRSGQPSGPADGNRPGVLQPGQTGTLPVQTDPAPGQTQQPSVPAGTVPEQTVTGPAQTDPIPTQTEQNPAQTQAPEQQEQPGATEATQPQVNESIDLGFGLRLTEAGAYSGMYMEDGSNERVEGVMMIVVSNEGEHDVQLADITAHCGDEEYQFRLTNLPVGARAMLLETNRRSPSGALSAAELTNTALFDEPMALYEDRIEVSGGEGYLTVRNISGEDIPAEIFVYYKYAEADLFHGGITFRVRVEGGLKAGEERQITAGHYSPGACAVVQVSIYE